jgi:hypothetical protein
MQRSALEVVGEVGAPWTEGERVVALLAPLAVLAVVVAAVGLGAAVELLIGAAGGPLALLLVVGLLVAAGLVEQSSPEHPFVREAARLCGRAVRKRRWERYVWRDEGEAVAGSGGSLDPATTDLLADIALLLNLMEHSERAEHLARLERSNAQPDLPRCMSESRKASSSPGPATTASTNSARIRTT